MREEFADFGAKRPAETAAEARIRPENRPLFAGFAIGSRFFAGRVFTRKPVPAFAMAR
jgi:hypothetical protein